MSRYVILYYAPISVKERFAQATPEEAMVGMQLWIDWAKKVGPALVYPGGPLGRGEKVTNAGSAPLNSTIVGMSILEAKSMDDALSMVRNHHHLTWAPDTEIVVLEEMGVPEMDRQPA